MTDALLLSTDAYEPDQDIERLSVVAARMKMPKKRLLRSMRALERSTNTTLVLQKKKQAAIYLHMATLRNLRGRTSMPLETRFSNLEIEVMVLRDDLQNLKGDVMSLLRSAAARR